MKKYYIILCCLLSSIQWIQAQDFQVQNDSTQIKSWTFGAKLGTSYLHSASNKTARRTALYLGLFVEKRLTNRWALDGGVIGQYDSHSEVTLEIPIVAKYYLNNKWSIFGGPKLDIYLVDFIWHGDSVPNPNITKLTPSFEIGTQFDVSKHFFIEARYSFGLDSYYDFPIYGKSNRNVLKAGVGYKF